MIETTAEEFNGEKRLDIIKELTIKLQAEIYNNGFLIDEVTKLKADHLKFIKELKEGIHWQMDGEMVIDLIDELAGDKLK